MLHSWLPFLIYGFLGLVIPSSMLWMSFKFSQRPAARTRARRVPFESGVSTGPLPRQRFSVSRAMEAGAWSGIAKQELTLISHRT